MDNAAYAVKSIPARLNKNPRWRQQNRKDSLPAAHRPVFPKHVQHPLVSRRPGHHPTQGETQQHGAGGRSRSLYFDWPVIRSINHFLGGLDDMIGVWLFCFCWLMLILLYCIYSRLVSFPSFIVRCRSVLRIPQMISLSNGRNIDKVKAPEW